METKGCQVVLVLIGVAIAVGMVMSTNPFAGKQGQENNDPLVFTVGDRKVTLNNFNDRVKVVAQNQPYGAGTAFAELTNTVTAVQAYIEEAANLSLAKEKGVSITDANIKEVADTAAKQVVDQYRAQLIMGGQIKPEATKEEADKLLTQFLGGKTPDQIVEEQSKDIVTKFNDPKTKQDIIGALIPTLLQEQYAKNTPYTEEDLKKSYEEYNFSIIRFDDLTKGLSEREESALAALDKIKSGTDFAAVQKEYNPDAKSEVKQQALTVGLLETTPELKPLVDLKPGEVSEIIMSSGSPTLYKLESVKPNLPPDYEKSKAMLLENNRASRARQLFQEEQKTKIEAFQPKFEDKGLKLAYDVFQEFNKPEIANDPVKLKTFLEDKKAEIRDPEFSSMYFQNLIAATEFLIVESLYSQATAEEKKELIDERIEAVRNMLASFEDNAFRLQFANELLNSDRAADAFQFALDAARNNGDYEITGQTTTDQITALTAQAETDKKWTAEQAEEIRVELKRWQDDRDQFLKDQAEIEEANKKAQEELDKESVGTVPPTDGETTPPADPTKPANEGN